MRVTVRLHSTLRKFLPGGARSCVELELSDGATVAELITRLGIPPAYAAIAASTDQQIPTTAALHDRQQIDLFPPLVGGL